MGCIFKFKHNNTNIYIIILIYNKMNFKTKLRNWINIERLDWHGLSKNPNAFHLLYGHNQINIYTDCTYINLIKLLEQNQYNNYNNFSSKIPNTVNILENYQYKNYLGQLQFIKNIIHVLKHTDPNNINWYSISKHLNAIHILEQNQDKIIWDYLSFNPNAIPLLEKNQDKIDWRNLSKNINAIHLL
jgi:hypothetical protein